MIATLKFRIHCDINIIMIKNNTTVYSSMVFIIITICVLGCILGIQRCSKTESSPPISEERYTVLHQALSNQIMRVLADRRLYYGVRVGIDIRTISGKQSLYHCHPESNFIPASAAKIFPSAIALDLLGSDYQYTTPIYYSGTISNGVLYGDIYIVGTGDSMLTTADLEKSAAEIKKQGITALIGDIVYDISYFDEEATRFGKQARNLYAPPCALTLNFNSIDLMLIEHPEIQLVPIPKTRYVKMSWDLTMEKSERPSRPAMTYTMRPDGDTYRIQGIVTYWTKAINYLRLGVSRPGLYTVTVFDEILHKNGITHTGGLKKGIVPQDVQLLTSIQSIPLSEHVLSMNRQSNNVIAEMINKKIGAEFNSVPGTREKGLGVMKKYLQERIRFKPERFMIADSSGLSKETHFTPNQFSSALVYFYHRKNIRDTFIESLVVQGHDPHAKTPVPPDSIRMLVKTGTLSVTGVNTVVGYIFLDAINEVYVFSVLANRVQPGEMTFSGTLTNPIMRAIIQALKETMPDTAEL